MKRNQFDAHCDECKQPCKRPKGNWNKGKVSLCKSVVCRRKRKTALQNQRRKKLSLFKRNKAEGRRLAVRRNGVAQMTPGAQKSKIADQVLLPVPANSRRPRKPVMSRTTGNDAVELKLKT
jgi:hypothetical protein